MSNGPGGCLTVAAMSNGPGGCLTVAASRYPSRQVPHRRSMPPAPTGCGDPPRIQGSGDLPQAGRTVALGLADQRENLGSVFVRVGLDGNLGNLASLRELFFGKHLAK
jgi:hypothetical protein